MERVIEFQSQRNRIRKQLAQDTALCQGHDRGTTAYARIWVQQTECSDRIVIQFCPRWSLHAWRTQSSEIGCTRTLTCANQRNSPLTLRESPSLRYHAVVPSHRDNGTSAIISKQI